MRDDGSIWGRVLMNSGGKKIISINQAHLCYIYPEKMISSDVLQSCFDILSDDEINQQHRFVNETDRYQYLVAHVFVRLLLSQYADVMPEDWIFKKNEYGKPSIEYPLIGLPLMFNISHTHGLIASIITLRHSVGIDVECVKREMEDHIRIAENNFSPDEVQNMLSLPPGKQRKRFYELWTLKEAYIKAKGAGLSIPLGGFSFKFHENNSIGIAFNKDVPDNPDNWKFHLGGILHDHVCAAAIECGDVPVEVVVRENEIVI